MTEDLDKLHVLITGVVMFFAGASAVHLRLWLLRRFLQQQDEREEQKKLRVDYPKPTYWAVWRGLHGGSSVFACCPPDLEEAKRRAPRGTVFEEFYYGTEDEARRHFEIGMRSTPLEKMREKKP